MESATNLARRNARILRGAAREAAYRARPLRLIPVMATEVSSWARHGTAPVIGPFRAIEAEYLRTGGVATWGEPVRRDLIVWAFREGCIAYDPRDGRAHELRGTSYRDFCDATRRATA